MESKGGAWSKRLRGLFLDGATSGEERAVMEGYRCGARGDTSKETLRAESPCVGAAVLCRAEARAPRARTAARGSAQGPEPTSTGAPRSASAPRAAPRPALPPSSAEAAAVPRGGAGRSGAVGAAPARPDEGRPERGPALLLSASRADGSGAAGRDGGRAGAVAAGLGLGAGRCEAGTAGGEAGAGRGSCCCPAGALRPGARLQCRGAAGSCAWEGEAVWGHGCCGSGRG